MIYFHFRLTEWDTAGQSALKTETGDWIMDVRTGDRLVMKKKHPCGSDTFLVLRIGADFKIRCEGCGHEIMNTRVKVEKNIRKILREESETD